MFDYSLFLGIPLDSPLKKHLAALDPKILKLFINDSGEYLQKAVFQNQEYLGKFVGVTSDVHSLTLVESNIVSVLLKLVPSYQELSHLFIIFPAQNPATANHS